MQDKFEHEDNTQVTDKHVSIDDWLNEGTKSYCPNKPPTFTEGEMQKFAENAKNIRTDDHNLRLDKKRNMLFYLPKNHPDYREHPEPEYVDENRNDNSGICTIF